MPGGVKVQFDAKDLAAVREDRFVGQGKVGWCQRNVVLWPSKGKGEIWSRKGGRGRRGDPIMLKRVVLLTQTLCKKPNKNEDKNETESSLR